MVWKAVLLIYLKWIKGLNSPSGVINFSLQRYRNRTFLIQPDKKAELTFAEFDSEVKKILGYFNSIGLRKGDILAYTARNCVEFFELRAACHFANIIFFGLPVNLSQETMVYFLNKSGARILFYMQTASIDINELTQKTGVRYYIDLQGDWLKTAPMEGKTDKEAFYEPGAIATLNLSSGTTRRTPKIARLSNENWMESLYAYLENSDIKMHKKIIFLCTVSFLTAGSTTFLPTMLAGATNIIIEEDSTVEALAACIDKNKVNRLYITPSRFLELFEWCQRNKNRLVSLENIILGTERMPAIRLKEAIDFFGPVITVGYGMVEALPPLSLLSTKKDRGKLDSAGKIIKGVDIKTEENGKLSVRSKTICQKYSDNPIENAQNFKNGRFYSGDYGIVDRQGFLFIYGREEEILAGQPRLIFAKTVEDKLYEIDYLNRCAVILKNDRIFIFVSLRGEYIPRKDDIKKDILEKIRQSPLKFNLDESIDSPRIIIKERLPVNFSGKLDRQLLSEEIE